MGWSFNSFLRDISERTHAEQARATAASELAHANHRLEIRNREVEEYSKFVRDFVAAASHELRTPLTSIMGYLEVVLESEEDGLGASQRRDLDIVYRNSQRLLSLVADLLTVNKIDREVCPWSCKRPDLRTSSRPWRKHIAPCVRKRHSSLW